MAVYFPSGEVNQIHGLPPLSEETYAKLAVIMKEMLKQYYEEKDCTK